MPTTRPPRSSPPLPTPPQPTPYAAPNPLLPLPLPLCRGLSESEGFVLHHFAGDVCYSSAGFMHANTEKLSPELEVNPT